MRPLGRRRIHYWLLMRMAKTVGADLPEAMEKRCLGNARWNEMVENCRRCEWRDGCKRWLDRHTGRPPAPVPGDCANRQSLRRFQTAEQTADQKAH